jgi:hypothetical protein
MPAVGSASTPAEDAAISPSQSAGRCRVGDIAFARLSSKDVEAWSNVAAWAQGIEALPGFTQPFDFLPMQDAEIAP